MDEAVGAADEELAMDGAEDLVGSPSGWDDLLLCNTRQ